MKRLAGLGERWGCEFPKGAVHVMEAAVAFARARGEVGLAEVAKLHFGTTAKVLGEVRRSDDG